MLLVEKGVWQHEKEEALLEHHQLLQMVMSDSQPR